MQEQIKIRKQIVYAVVVTFIVTLIISYVLFKYIPSTQENNQLNEYKKALFSSTICQYSCPLEEQVYQNKTQLLPGTECVKSCTESFRELQKWEQFSNEQLKNDNLIADVEKVVSACRTSSILEGNNTIPSIDNVNFFSCVSKDLESLKKNYPYLN